MKKFLLLFLVVGYVSCKKLRLELSLDEAKKMKAAEETCSKQVGASVGSFKRVMEKVEVADRTFENQVFCVQNNLGFGQVDGTLKIAEFTQFWDMPRNNELVKLTELCNKNKGVDAVETAGNMFKCFNERATMIFNLDKV